jgi:ATP-dependent helicase/nuclease subunit A
VGITREHTYPHIHYLRASAGAGKTYQLTVRFLLLLAGMRPSAESLRQVVAITFTNRAAAEMKERIILALKQIALEEEAGNRLMEETGLRLSEASAWLDTIIDHFSDFHVRTIDSLVYALLRAFSIEMGLRPELEVVFDQDTIIDSCFDRLLAHAQWGDEGDRLYQLFKALIETYLRIEEASGLVVEGGIRRRVRELYGAVDTPSVVDHPPDLHKAESELVQMCKKLLTALNKEGASEYLHRRAFQVTYLRDPVPHLDRAFFEKASFRDLFTSRAQGIDDNVIAYLDALYQDIRELRDAYLDILARVKVYPYMRVLDALQREIKRLSRREGVVLGHGWYPLVREYLQEGQGAGAYAFVKLGGMVRHFLFDEFQDTSRQQWETLLPLLEESLATGGSFFYVGDIKQAIYGWRGGDWRLFKEVVTDYFPTVPPSRKKGGTLTVNYRSLPHVVDFNNSLYRHLTDTEFSQRIAAMVLGDSAQDWAKTLLAQSIQQNFEDVVQEKAPHVQEGQTKGVVKIISLRAAAEELREAVHVNLLAQVQEIWEHRSGNKGIAVLVRRNKDAEDVAAWLIAMGIPVITENSLRLRSSDLIKGIIAFLRFLDYPLDDLSLWGALASRLFRGMPDFTPEALESFLSQGKWQPPLYKSFERIFPRVSEGIIRPLLARVGFVSPYDLVREVAERFLLLERFPGEAIFIYRLFELIFQAETGGQRSLAHFLQFWDEGGMEEKIGLPEEVSAVHVLTIHKAKGLEFPVVFVPFTNWRLERPTVAKLDDGSFVNLKRPLPPQLEEKRTLMMINSALEALNLLYVATTRAKEELYLYETSLPLPRGEGIDRSYLSAWLREMLIQQGYAVS